MTASPARVSAALGGKGTAAGTTVTTTSGEVFVRGWDNENGPTDYPHPEILDYDRWQLTGDLLVKSN